MADLYLTPQELAARDEANAEARKKFEADPRGQRAKKHRQLLSLLGGVFLTAGLLFALIAPLLFDPGWRIVLSGVIASFVLGSACVGAGTLIYQNELESFRPQAHHQALSGLDQKNVEMLQESQLPALIVFNREEMGRYHKIATTQATRASRQSQIAIMVGFLVLVVGAVSAVRVHDETSKVLIAGLASLGGVFSAYITRTFFEAERAAVAQLYTYWKQPLSASYLLFAERVAKDLNELDNRAASVQLAAVIKQGLTIAATDSPPVNGHSRTRHGQSRSRKRASSSAVENGAQTEETAPTT